MNEISDGIFGSAILAASKYGFELDSTDAFFDPTSASLKMWTMPDNRFHGFDKWNSALDLHDKRLHKKGKQVYSTRESFAFFCRGW